MEFKGKTMKNINKVALICSLIIAVSPTLSIAQSHSTIDIMSPHIAQSPINFDQNIGDDVSLSVNITDDTGVKEVEIYYRYVGEVEFTRVLMSTGGGSAYFVTIPSKDKNFSGIEYFIQARDTSGNTSFLGNRLSPKKFTFEKKLSESINPAIGRTNSPDKSKSSKMKWVWIGLGVLAAGAVASTIGSDNDGPIIQTTTDDTGDLDIVAPVP